MVCLADMGVLLDAEIHKFRKFVFGGFQGLYSGEFNKY